MSPTRKITYAYPIQFGSNAKRTGRWGELVARHLPDYEPDPNDVALDVIPNRIQWNALSTLYKEWHQRGLVCFVAVVDFDEKWSFLDRRIIARFTKSDTALIFKLTVSF